MKKLLLTLVASVAGLAFSPTAFAGWSSVCRYSTTNQCADWLHNPWKRANESGWHFAGNVAGGYHTVDIKVLYPLPQIQITLDGYYYGTFSTQLVSASKVENSFDSIIDYSEDLVFNVIVDGTVFPVRLSASLKGVSSVETVRIGACVTISGSTSCRAI
jgi:hypothetical protein